MMACKQCESWWVLSRRHPAHECPGCALSCAALREAVRNELQPKFFAGLCATRQVTANRACCHVLCTWQQQKAVHN